MYEGALYIAGLRDSGEKSYNAIKDRIMVRKRSCKSVVQQIVMCGALQID